MDREVDVEKEYALKDVVAKLRRLADALEKGEPFEIQISGERIYMPVDVNVEFEYQQNGEDAEMEIEVTWKKK